MDSSFVAFVDERDLRERILGVLNDLCVTLERLLPHAELQHIGSTSIPGAITKGDLDICVLVERSGFENADRVLAQHFARNVGSNQAESLSSFVDDSRAVPVGIQLVVRGGREDFFVRWRDLLRGSPEILTAYNELKRGWHGRSHESYRMAKSTFIERQLHLSSSWGEAAV